MVAFAARAGWAQQAMAELANDPALLKAMRTALVREATFGLTQREPAERIPVGQGVAGTVAVTGRAMILASPAAGITALRTFTMAIPPNVADQALILLDPGRPAPAWPVGRSTAAAAATPMETVSRTPPSGGLGLTGPPPSSPSPQNGVRWMARRRFSATARPPSRLVSGRMSTNSSPP